MTTLKDIATHAGVSIATVSNFLTGKKNVSQEKIEVITKAMEALNYDNEKIKKITDERSMTIGFIVSQLDTVYFPSIIRGIQKVAEENGYSLIFYPTNYNAQTEKKHLKNLINSKADGIVLDTVITDADQDYWKEVSNLKRNGRKIPIVSIQNDLSQYQIPSITLNNFQGGYTATEHLIKKGCQKIACITGPSHIRWAASRFEGYKQCLIDNNFEYNSSYVGAGNGTPIYGYQIINQFLVNFLDFDGIFSQNDLMAIGAIKALETNNLRVPDDIKIIGYDNVFVSSLTTPSISTINIPKQLLGEESARLLINLINNQAGIDPNYCKVLPLQLIERQSTNPEKQTDWELYLL